MGGRGTSYRYLSETIDSLEHTYDALIKKEDKLLDKMVDARGEKLKSLENAYKTVNENLRQQEGTLQQTYTKMKNKIFKANNKDVMTEQEYLRKHGVNGLTSGFEIDKHTSNRQIKTQRGKERFDKEADKARTKYFEKKARVRAEYHDKVKRGEIVEKSAFRTEMERALTLTRSGKARAIRDANRRMLTKRGYDWRTGKKMK